MIVRENMTKTIVSVSKKHNSVWRIYYYDIEEYDETLKLYTKRINPLLVWYYKLIKSKKMSDICDECYEEFPFYKNRFSSIPNQCTKCDDEEYSILN